MRLAKSQAHLYCCDHMDCVDEKDARYPKARFTKLQTNGSVCGLKRKNRRMSI